MIQRIALICTFLFSITLLLAACGQQPVAISPVALPQGWQTVRDGTLVFALPATWEVVNVADGNFEGALDDLVQTNPQLAAVAKQGKEALAGGQISIMAFDLDPKGSIPNFTSNLSVGQSQLERIASLDEVGAANEQQLTASGFKNVQRDAVQIGSRDAVRLRSMVTMQSMGDEGIELAVDQYIVVEGQQQFVMTFTTTSAERARMQPMFEQIVGTLQVE